MNFSSGFLVALALTTTVFVNAGPVSKSNELDEIFDEFHDFWPQEKLRNICGKYSTIPQFWETMEYIFSPKFRSLVIEIETMKDVKNLFDYLTEAGFDSNGWLNLLHQLLGLPPVIPEEPAAGIKSTGTFADFIAEAKSVLPIDEIDALHREKIKTSLAFAKLVEYIESPRFHDLIVALGENEEFRSSIDSAEEAGFPFFDFIDFLATSIGFGFAENQDVIDF